jgi:hypothetical protein
MVTLLNLLGDSAYSGQLSTGWRSIVFERFAAEPVHAIRISKSDVGGFNIFAYLSSPLGASREHLDTSVVASMLMAA